MIWMLSALNIYIFLLRKKEKEKIIRRCAYYFILLKPYYAGHETTWVLDGAYHYSIHNFGLPRRRSWELLTIKPPSQVVAQILC